MENLEALADWLALFVYLAMALAVLTARRDAQMERLRYAALTVPLLIFLTIVKTQAILGNVDGPWAFGLGLLSVLMAFLIVRWSAHRLVDAGHSRWFALLILVPYVYIAVVLILCFLPTHARYRPRPNVWLAQEQGDADRAKGEHGGLGGA